MKQLQVVFPGLVDRVINAQLTTLHLAHDAQLHLIGKLQDDLKSRITHSVKLNLNLFKPAMHKL